jgi:peptidoglycan hydrolase CwlO-like protein
MRKTLVILMLFAIMISFVSSTAHARCVSGTPAQTQSDPRFLEEQRIGRILLEVENLRNTTAISAEENKKLNQVVAQLDRQLITLQEMANEYHAASDSRQVQIDTYEKLTATYKAALTSADKQIARLTKQNKLLRKLLGAAVVAGLVVGYVVGSR